MIPVLDSLIEILVGKLVDAGIKEIVAILNVESEMVALKVNMTKIKLKLDEAKTKKIESKSINHWLAELREVAYDVEDLLDDFAAAKLGKSFPGFLKGIPMKNEISSRIKKIDSNLSKIYSEAATLQLLESLPDIDKKIACLTPKWFRNWLDNRRYHTELNWLASWACCCRNKVFST